MAPPKSITNPTKNIELKNKYYKLKVVDTLHLILVSTGSSSVPLRLVTLSVRIETKSIFSGFKSAIIYCKQDLAFGVTNDL